jgi:uncharacterized protein
MLKSLMAGVTLALTLTLASNVLAADASTQKRRVVIQVSDNDEKIWSHALSLAENMQVNSGGKDKVDIEIVAMSPGIKMVGKDSSASERVSKAVEKGILVRACGFAMSVMHWGPEKLAPGVEIVPFGAIEVVDKQHEGWSYIKP